jgi:hypothetical protein
VIVDIAKLLMVVICRLSASSQDEKDNRPDERKAEHGSDNGSSNQTAR